MLGQYMSSIGFGVYQNELNGLGDLGALPSLVANFLFTPEEIKEGEYKGAKLSKGFRIEKRGENHFIVPKGGSELTAIVGSASDNPLLSVALTALGSVAGKLTGVEVMIPDIKKPFTAQTEVGGTLVYEPKGMNMLLIAGAAGVGLLVLLVLMRKK